MTSAQLRGARAMVGWTVRDLADKAEVHRNTVVRGEAAEPAEGPAIERMVAALTRAGIVFLDDDGNGVGIRFRPPRRRRR